MENPKPKKPQTAIFLGAPLENDLKTAWDQLDPEKKAFFTQDPLFLEEIATSEGSYLGKSLKPFSTHEELASMQKHLSSLLQKITEHSHPLPLFLLPYEG